MSIQTQLVVILAVLPPIGLIQQTILALSSVLILTLLIKLSNSVFKLAQAERLQIRLIDFVRDLAQACLNSIDYLF